MPWYSNSLPMPTRNLRKCQFIWQSYGMSQPAAALSFTNMMNPHLFFLSFSLSFLLVALAMACDKPVGLSPCASKGIFFHHCLRRLVLNRTHDREIPLRNARMRYKFRRKYEEEPCGELSLRLPERLVSGDDNEQRTCTLYFYGMKDSCHRIAWDAATCCGTLDSQHDEPTFFFSSSSRRSCSLASSSSTSSIWGRSCCHKTRAGDQKETGWRGRRRTEGRPRRKRRGPCAQHAKLPRSGERSLSADFSSSWMSQP